MLNRFLHSNGLISKNQFGFTPQKSPIHALKQLTGQIERVRKENKHGVLVSLDIKGTFDNVKTSSIVRRLRECSVPSHLLAIITDFLTDRTVRFTLNNKTHSRTTTN